MNDVDLLEQHRNGNEQAFAEIVRRHIGWVFGMAKRRLRDAHLSEDVAQAVFILLHRKGPRFPADRALVRWLHKTAWYTTRVAERNQRRREKRETEAAMARPITTESLQSNEWTELAPVLDEMIGRLSRADREAVLLRYYRDLSFAQVAVELGASEEAARKRVERAVEKLRRFAAEKGLAISGATLALNLAGNIRVPVPPGLVASTIGAVTSHGVGIGASITSLLKGTNMILTIKSAIAPVCVAIAMLAAGASILAVLPPSQEQPSVTPIARPFPARTAIAPAIRWRADTPEVQIKGTWYELLAVDDLAVSKIISFTKSWAGPNDWQRQIQEDYDLVLQQMKETPGPGNLQLRTLDTDKLITMEVPVTAENRNLIMFGEQYDFTKGTLTLFSAVRRHDSTAQVQINGNDTWYELTAIDNQPAAEMIAFATKTYGDQWQKRIEDNSVEVLNAMRHKFTQTDAWLQLRTLDTNESVKILKRIYPPLQLNIKAAVANPGIRYPRLSPFSAVRWAEDGYEVQLDGKAWYDLLSINDVQFSQIMDFARKTYGSDDMEHKRIDEDLVEVLTTMGNQPGKTVKLGLRSVDTDEVVTRENVPMTEGNRRAILSARQPTK